MSESANPAEAIWGTWFYEGGFSRMRLCRDGTWHDTVYSGPFGKRWGLRVTLHGDFTFDGLTLILVTKSKSMMRWRKEKIEKEREVLDRHAATISRVSSLDQERMVLGDYVRQLGDVETQIVSTATYFRSRPIRSQ